MCRQTVFLWNWETSCFFLQRCIILSFQKVKITTRLNKARETWVRLYTNQYVDTSIILQIYYIVSVFAFVLINLLSIYSVCFLSLCRTKLFYLAAVGRGLDKKWIPPKYASELFMFKYIFVVVATVQYYREGIFVVAQSRIYFPSFHSKHWLPGEGVYISTRWYQF